MTKTRYQCHLKAFGPKQTLPGLLTFAGLFLLLQFDVIETAIFWLYSIGILVTLVILYVESRTVVWIEMEGNNVTLYYGGMVQANLDRATINQVHETGLGNLRKIAVVTQDGLKFYLPAACFDSEVRMQIIHRLMPDSP